MRAPRRVGIGIGIGIGAVLAATLVPVPSPSQAAAPAAGDARCTVVGTRGPDVLRGTRGRDVICGLGGRDRIDARGGDDVVRSGGGRDVVDAGRGDDVVLGSGGGDVIDGAGGDDVLDGGPGGDDVDGGPGFNICDAPAAPGDEQVRCVVDAARPAVEGVVVTPSTIDVSDEAQVAQVQAHVTDDTGATNVQIGARLAVLASGTPRDGIWEAALSVPRYTAPGPHELFVHVRDRVGRHETATVADAYTVVNSTPDQEMPVLQSLTTSTSEVDVREAAAPVEATIRLTDDLAGAETVFLCASHAFPTGEPSFRQAGPCSVMQMTAGTPVDATWRGTYVVPEGAPSGTWNLSVWVEDGAGNFANDFWFGPDELAAIGDNDEPRYRAIPDGAGVFSVVGVEQDANAPALTSVVLSPTTVDTATGAVQVTADISGTDVEGVTDALLVVSGWPGYPDDPDYPNNLQLAHVEDFELVSGTPTDGTWRATFVVAGGTPDGSYFLQVVLRDTSHFESWMSPGSGAVGPHPLTPDLAPAGSYLVVANS